MSSYLGGYVPCQESQSEHAKKLCQWAVAEHNKQGHHLTFVSLLKCESQVVDGTNWRLVMKCKDENNYEGNYEAVVWEKILEGFLQLISFFPLLT
ncbi:cysteine proteinase inhibitor 5-like [Cucumis melo var. makuwa]|uniref:Cysteine proteinase inhibitor 5-like n=2 Tax=Cucumis melo TaxID=3656 RepID=A0A5A7TBL3_CUCMM|nr:cysteine proteinase inhibitor 5-like [Cucumis melo var. makuwa]